MNTDLFQKPFTDMHYGAILSECGLYRYQLTRWWDDALPFALLWMLNPSIADARRDDPTIRRGISFARREGCGGLIVVNWFAWRATDPQELFSVYEPTGAENKLWIRNAIDLCDGPLIAAWGASRMADSRLTELPELIGDRKLKCLGVTKDGSPRHPLYVRADTPLVDWPLAGSGVA